MKRVLICFLLVVFFLGCAKDNINLDYGKQGSDFYVDKLKLGKIESYRRKGKIKLSGTSCMYEFIKLDNIQCSNIKVATCKAGGRFHLRNSFEEDLLRIYKNQCSREIINDSVFMVCGTKSAKYYITHSNPKDSGYSEKFYIRSPQTCYLKMYIHFKYKEYEK